MTPAPVPLALNFGMARASVGSGGSLVNLYVQEAPAGAKADVVLVGAPGTSEHAQLTYDADPGAPVVTTNETAILGMVFAFDKIIAVAEHALYEVEEDGTWEATTAGGRPGPISMAFNRLDVAVVNGTNQSYWWNPTDGVDLIESEDADMEVADSVAFTDGYFVFNRQGTGQVFQTGAYSREIDAIDFTDAESYPDDVVGVYATPSDLYVFGETSTEVFYNAGAAQFAFLPVAGAAMEHGCASARTVASFDSVVYWLTNNGAVVAAAGMRPTRISDPQVEDALAERRADWASAFGFCYSDRGNAFYQITVGDLTLCYNAATGYWHQVRNYSRGCHIGTCYVRAWNRHFVGTDDGRILEMSAEFFDDAGEPLIAEVVTMPYTGNRQFTSVGAFEIEIDTGLSPLGEAYEWRLSATRNGGVTWGTEIVQRIGANGDRRRRLQWRKLGAGLEHRFRLRASDPFRRVLLGQAHMVL